MDLGTVLSVAQTLFSALQTPQLKEIFSFLGYESQLDELQSTVDTVKAVLLDAEGKEVSSHEAKHYIQQLKDAVYDADDLFDEFVTLAEQKQLIKGGKASKKVRRFFSRYNHLGVAYNMSQRVKKIRKNLDGIASNHQKFGFSVNSEPIRKRREETCSYVYEGSIIGRDNDVEKIVGSLMGSNNQKDVSFLTIVGIGGLGKTALAQLVYNDARVISAFPLRLWTCVSDNEQGQLNWDKEVEGILRKILAAITHEKDDKSTKEGVQLRLREKLMHTRFFLVLDDVWTEDRNNWCNLVEFLLGGQRGSWIVVTTRSHETARIVGDSLKYELQGLVEEKSWELFEKTAFESQQLNPQDELVKIGREIVRGCTGVPLAIRVAGSLLYGQDKSRWISFQKIGVCNFKEKSKNGIMPILKLSYDQLDSQLKSCFSYCAIFPKDYEIEKDLLISLWMAQGYIVPFEEGQNLEDAGEEYFSILLRRCFFQDVECDEIGDIFSCKIHDLMHDIAQTVAGKEICVSNNVTIGDGKVRHLACVEGHSTLHQNSFSQSHIRSFLQVDTRIDDKLLKALLANWMCLRVLDLNHACVENLPVSIGKMIHLRYLNLSENRILEVLPTSIVKLYNLQTLKLRRCEKLKELPNDFSKLVELRVLELSECRKLSELPKDMSKLEKLRVLDIENCYELTSMPPGMNKLTCLHKLTNFEVDRECSSWKDWFNQLEELRDLNSLKGKLCVIIRFPKNATKIEGGGRSEGGYLKSKEHLKHVCIKRRGVDDEEGIRVMEEMQPHSNLKVLEIFDTRMPRWVRENNLVTSLPNLIRLVLVFFNMENLYNLTSLGNLAHLKDLTLGGLKNLEYIIESSGIAANAEPTTSTSTGLSIGDEMSFFPSLEKLAFWRLKDLKGWVIDNNNEIHVDGSSNISLAPLCLPLLKTLKIHDCPDLIAILQCPMVEDLDLREFNKELQIITVIKELRDEKGDASSGSSNTSFSKLREVNIDNVAWLNSVPMPIEAFQCLVKLEIWDDDEVESLGKVGEVFRICLSSLRDLHIEGCGNLRSVVSGGLEHLTAVETLEFINCSKLSLCEDEREDGTGTPWQPLFHHSLHELTLYRLPQLVDLPKWMQYLTALQTLEIRNCEGIESLPNWMAKLTSLSNLHLWGCSARLKERCQNSTGEDWPLIQHIPQIYF